MAEDVLGSFIGKKKADSQWLTLEDGETIRVVSLKAIKPLTKTGFGGEEKEILRFVIDVETTEGVREKWFDNGTQRFATEVQEKGVKVGSGFKLTRNGLQTKTRYTISEVTGGSAPSAPSTPTQAQPATPEK